MKALSTTGLNRIGTLFCIIFLCYTTAASIPRNDDGRIKRNPAVVREFKRMTGYPDGRKGYEIDHITPLKRGGCDSIENLQWISVEDHRRKSGAE